MNRVEYLDTPKFNPNEGMSARYSMANDIVRKNKISNLILTRRCDSKNTEQMTKTNRMD